jgi:acetyl/propionyl-CoA carboxylase alpha subunit
VYLPERECSM